MEKIRSHRDLKVWQKGIDAAMAVFEILSMLATMSNHPDKWCL